MGHSQFRSPTVYKLSVKTHNYRIQKIVRNIHSYVNHMMPLSLQCVFYVYHICICGCIYARICEIRDQISLLLSTLLLFENIIIAFADLCIYLFVHVQVCVCVNRLMLSIVYICGSQKTTYESWFCPSIMWAPVIELRSLDLVVSTLPH